MRLRDFDSYIRSIFELDALAAVDPSLNGVQVGDLDATIERAAFAVDAALETIRRAAEWKAGLLFVHHGLFWGREQPITGDHFRRIKLLIDSHVALYAVHLPLDKHERLGNNAQMAEALGLGDTAPFGAYKGVEIGVRGRLPSAATANEVAMRLFGSSEGVLSTLPFGPERIETVAIVSGGAPDEVDEAIELGVDLFITGDASHTIYHRCLEAGINVIFGGHYATETWGPRAVMDGVRTDVGVETTFIELPTGL